MRTMNQPRLKIWTNTLQQTDPASSASCFEQPQSSSKQHEFDNPSIKFHRAAKTNCLLRRSDYSIHLVNTPEQRIKTSTLIKRMYKSRGYQAKDAPVFSAAPYQYTFEARQAQQPIGTLTLTLDTHQGLLADTLYKAELDCLRRQRRKICEISKLAFVPNSSSKEIFATMFHIAYLYADRLHSAQDALIEVNPRHAPFYQRMLGFCQIGEKRTCPRVNAPAVLLRLELEYMGNKISINAKKIKQEKKDLYSFFLNQYEEDIIQEQLIRQIPVISGIQPCARTSSPDYRTHGPEVGWLVGDIGLPAAFPSKQQVYD